MNKKEQIVVLLIGSWALSSMWWHLIAYLTPLSVAVWAFMIWVALACTFKWIDLLNKN